MCHKSTSTTGNKNLEQLFLIEGFGPMNENPLSGNWHVFHVFCHIFTML